MRDKKRPRASEEEGAGQSRQRFGPEALKFISARERRSLRLRGIYLKIVSPGSIAPGDPIRKV